MSPSRIGHSHVCSARFRGRALSAVSVALWSFAWLAVPEPIFAQAPVDARYGFVAAVTRHVWTPAPQEALGPSFTAMPDFGPGFGVYVDGLTGRRVGITVEALVQAAGSAQKRTNGERVDWSFWNLEVPVLARARLLDRRVQPILVAGLAPGFRVTGMSIVAEDGRREAPDDVPPNRFWIGAVVGAGVDIGRFGVHVRYTRGLRQVFVGPPSTPRIHPRVANVLIRLAFR